MPFYEVFITAFIVSYLGSIPPGTINISVMQMSIQNQRRAALYFGLGAALIELVYVAITVKFQQFLYEHERLTVAFQIVTGIVLVILGIINLRSKITSKNFLPHGSIRRRTGFKRGVTLGLLNPMTVPFWLIVTNYLVTHHWVTVTGENFWAYVTGLAVGTFFLMITVDFLGSKFQKISDNTLLVHRIPGILFILMGFYTFWKITW